MAYSSAVNLVSQFYSRIQLGIVRSLDKKLPSVMNNKELEKLALDIANKKTRDVVVYVYESISFLALAYIALNVI